MLPEFDAEEIASWWAAAQATTELALQTLPHNDSHRPGLMAFRRCLGDASLVLTEYREWRRRFPGLTATLTRAGRQAAMELGL